MSPIENPFEQKKLEEERRERNSDELERWLAIQDAIAWAEAQQPEPRNSPSSRIREQKAKNNNWNSAFTV
jgi:hypothetical protein